MPWVTVGAAAGAAVEAVVLGCVTVAGAVNATTAPTLETAAAGVAEASI
jgi:hypothetical protein